MAADSASRCSLTSLDAQTSKKVRASRVSVPNSRVARPTRIDPPRELSAPSPQSDRSIAPGPDSLSPVTSGSNPFHESVNSSMVMETGCAVACRCSNLKSFEEQKRNRRPTARHESFLNFSQCPCDGQSCHSRSRSVLTDRALEFFARFREFLSRRFASTGFNSFNSGDLWL